MLWVLSRITSVRCSDPLMPTILVKEILASNEDPGQTLQSRVSDPGLLSHCLLF